MTQLLITAVIWTGMAFFFSDMNAQSKAIFYLVTSWLLFLIVIILRTLLGKRKSK
ncbi:hypothetical protein MST22_12315 [Virgibacillus halodenitrificans]|uniref:hypothetical protein n=1 Tax=Virgibacillus halodenitrificans TaxID=1482 RepID=UPI001678BFC6|nr:hypothetical protein [Virgibacillus halodenitrificans]MCJ0931937.1 hypothetical protein [Virgibacillus halodenitrificans]